MNFFKKGIGALLSCCLITGTACSTAFAVAAGDGNDSFDQAKPIEANETITQNLPDGDPADFYQVTLSQPGVVNLQFNHDYVDNGSSYWNISFYNQNNQQLVSYGVQGSVTRNIYDKFGVPAGTYYVKVAPDYRRSDKSYNFTVNYQPSEFWEREFNNDFDTSDKIQPNQAVNGSLMTNQDADCFKINLPSDGPLQLVFNHDYVDNGSSLWKINLLNQDYEPLIQYGVAGKDVKNPFQEIGVPAGDYYVKVSPDYRYSAVPYELTINHQSSNSSEKEFNDAFAKAEQVSPDKVIKGNLMHSADKDFYKVNIPSSGPVSITFNHDYVDNGSNLWVIGLYNEDYQLQQESRSNGKTTENTFEELPLSAGNYYVEIKVDYRHSDAPYELIINTSGQSSDPTDDQEPGNDDPGSEEPGNEDPGDTDTYPSSNLYPDVDGSDLDYFGILYSKENEIMTGYESGLFGPNNTLKRGELITILHRMEGKPTSYSSGFDDVPSWSFYKNATNWAKDTGVITGNLNRDGSWTFDGEDPVTKQDAALIFYRYAKNIKGDMRMGPLTSLYYDYSDEVGEWAEEGIRWALSNNLLRLDVESDIEEPLREELYPRDYAPRGWIATLIQRYLDPGFVGDYSPSDYMYEGEFTLNTSLSSQLQKGAFDPEATNCIASVDLSTNGEITIEYIDGDIVTGEYMVHSSVASTVIQVLTDNYSSWTWPCIYRDGLYCIVTSNGILTD